MSEPRQWSLRSLLWPLVYRIWRITIEELLVDRCPVLPYPAGDVGADDE